MTLANCNATPLCHKKTNVDFIKVEIDPMATIILVAIATAASPSVMDIIS